MNNKLAMKKYVVLAVVVALMSAPAGLAFADDQVDVGTTIGVHMVSSGDHEMDDEHTNASSSLELGDDHEGVHLNASTSMERGGRENKDASSTDENNNGQEGDRHDSGADGKSHSFFASFFAWLFAQPASTTVGQIQSELQASTTASTTVQIHDNGRHEGFFARLFSFFGFGGNQGE